MIAIALASLLAVLLAPETATAYSHQRLELRPGESTHSADGRFRLVHQHDGNVVFYGPSGGIWQTKTAGQDTSHFVFQDDGNLVLYGQGRALWHTGTNNKGNVFAVQDDANLVVYNSTSPVWAIRGMTPPLNQRGSTADGCGGWEHTVAHYFGWETPRACRVMMCESGGNPTAKNPSSTASGLFQFLDGTWRSTTGTAPPARAYSPSTQVAAAKKLRDAQGWSPWECK